MEPIEIYVGRQRDGATYALSPLWRLRFGQEKPKRPLHARLFLSYEIENNLETSHGPVIEQIAMILTGLSKRKLRDLGGFRVIDPVSHRALFDRAVASA